MQLILESLVLHYEETDERQTLRTLDDSGAIKLTELVSLRQGLDWGGRGGAWGAHIGRHSLRVRQRQVAEALGWDG